MPELEALRSEYEARGVRFLALSLNPNEERNRQTAAELGVHMTVATAKGEVLGPLRLSTVPATVFINREGVVVATVNGERSREFHARRLEALLAAPE
ncbi:hypothetical protein WA016_01816 [Myxococcus stipitatus]